MTTETEVLEETVVTSEFFFNFIREVSLFKNYYENKYSAAAITDDEPSIEEEGTEEVDLTEHDVKEQQKQMKGTNFKNNYCIIIHMHLNTAFARNNPHPEIRAHRKSWFPKGGSTQNRWLLTGDFSKGGVHNTDGFWNVFLLLLKIKLPGRLFRQIRYMYIFVHFIHIYLTSLVFCRLSRMKQSHRSNVCFINVSSSISMQNISVSRSSHIIPPPHRINA